METEMSKKLTIMSEMVDAKRSVLFAGKWNEGDIVIKELMTFIQNLQLLGFCHDKQTNMEHY